MKRRYRPDSLAMMRIYETNFARLQRLFPSGEAPGATLTLHVATNQYVITLIETTRYTSQITIHQIQPELCYWQLPTLSVRLYYDARVAEVCATKHIRHFKGRYDYPNKMLHQCDEKHQVNLLLAEWLHYCLVHGSLAISAQ